MKPGKTHTTVVTATDLAAHLFCSREAITRLEKQHVLERLPAGGYDLDDCRRRVLEHLRNRRPPDEHRKEFEKSRAAREKLKLMKESGEVCYMHEFIEAGDQLVYVVQNRLAPVPGQVGGRDLKLRKLVEDKLRAAQNLMSADMLKLADELDKGTGKASRRDVAGDTESP
jgi:hypothetical protein